MGTYCQGCCNSASNEKQITQSDSAPTASSSFQSCSSLSSSSSSSSHFSVRNRNQMGDGVTRAAKNGNLEPPSQI